jgi:hypothetical protein
MPLTASRTARYRKLADDLDAALARSDEIGMELLKNMLPELGDAIEEINEGLRETDALLFEGLRDEAIGLHDPELASVALRLHLPEKPHWPAVASVFENEGIAVPPALDFEALTALNAAYAELEHLRRPLDRLRRLALERAPLARRISLLRQFRQHDSGKPVWSDQLASHEEERILELKDAVRKATKSRDCDVLAALQSEVADPHWSVPVPNRLKEDTRGADVWCSLRKTLSLLEPLTLQLELTYARRDSEDNDQFDFIDNLRILRKRWLAGEAECREHLFSLPQFPAVVGLAQPEDFAGRLAAFRDKVSATLEWLTQVDRRDDLRDRFRHACNELELLTDKPPGPKQETKWLAQIEKAEIDLQQCCQQLPHLTIPESLPVKLDRAVADVRRRIARRGRNRVAVAGVAVLAAIALVAGVALFVQAWREQIEATAYVQSLLPDARQGEYVVRPELLERYASRFAYNSTFALALDEFDKLAEGEQQRRHTFDDLTHEHNQKLDEAARLLTERAMNLPDRLEEWPAVIYEANEKYQAARSKGGFPKQRGTTVSIRGKVTDETDLPPAARQRLDNEETRLAEQEAKQTSIERAYSNAASDEFGRQLQEIAEEMPAAEMPEVRSLAEGLLGRLNTVLAQAKSPRTRTKQSGRRVSTFTVETAEPLRLRLEALMRDATSSR